MAALKNKNFQLKVLKEFSEYVVFILLRIDNRLVF